jgi:hypothetical protein
MPCPKDVVREDNHLCFPKCSKNIRNLLSALGSFVPDHPPQMAGTLPASAKSQRLPKSSSDSTSTLRQMDSRSLRFHGIQSSRTTTRLASHWPQRRRSAVGPLMSSKAQSNNNLELLNRVRSILDGKGLTVHGLSKLSEKTFGQSSRHFISHNFYYDLRMGNVCPNIYQVFALSCLSNYRLVDWLRVFGFELDEIPRLQTLLNRSRTVILNSTNYDSEAGVSWFKTCAPPEELDKITPIVRIIRRAGTRRLRSIERWNRKSFIYAKVGQEDALAFPDLVPGSVLRVNPGVPSASEQTLVCRSSRHLYLVEHSEGLTCCRLHFISAGRVGLISDHLPLGNRGFHLDKEIRILGVADLEIHPLGKVPLTPVSTKFHEEWTLQPIRKEAGIPTPSALISSFRLRNGLQFREASRLSKEVAENLGDIRYFLTPRSLFTYERLEALPRHIHKIMSLCIIYCIAFWDFLRSAGLDIEQLGHEPISKDLLPRVMPMEMRRLAREDGDPPQLSLFPETLFEEIPLFLRRSLTGLVGLADFSVRDVFWTGGSRQPFHPLLADSYFVIVNRRVKRAPHSHLSRPWESPLYLILLRDGTYICGPCTMKDDAIILHPHPASSLQPMTFRNGMEAEIAGRVVTVIRKL